MTSSTATRPTALEYTKNDEANRLLVSDPVAFLIGWVLDQQITVQKAFEGPLVLRERLGTLDPAKIAATDPDKLIEIFTTSPVIHRYGASMARRVRACMEHVVEHYGGDPSRIWTEAADYADFGRRLLAVPGFGKVKVPGVAAVLSRRMGVTHLHGWEDELAPYGSLSDVELYDDLLAYQQRKRAYKAEKRAAAAQ